MLNSRQSISGRFREIQEYSGRFPTPGPSRRLRPKHCWELRALAENLKRAERGEELVAEDADDEDDGDPDWQRAVTEGP